MNTTPLRVQMLGGFSIRRKEKTLRISDRSRKLCLLLAFLIWERKRSVPWEELAGLLQMDQSPGALNTLKALVHRARTDLDQLEPGAGRSFLIRRAGCYQWRPDLPLTLDAEEFVRLCQGEGQSERLSQKLEGLALYRGGLLPALSSHPWAAGQACTLRELYLQTLLDVLPPLSAQERWLMCNYDFFRIVCHSMARMAERSGDSLHVALISLTGPEDSTLPKASLDRAMDNLEWVILSHMRRGDTATRCSASQFLLLLPWASYENGRMICGRISRAFARQFPHSPARLQFSVQPLLSEA